MNNYSIDASVYAFPFHFNGKTWDWDAGKIENYCRTINYITRLVGGKGRLELRHIKYFFFGRDIDLIEKNFLFPYSVINQMKELLKSNDNDYFDVKDVQSKFQTLIKRLKINDKSSNNDDNTDIQEKILFEKWFKIEDIHFTPGKEPSLPNVVSGKVCNQVLINNAKKNIVKIAYLNEHVYKSSELHNIILGNCNTSQIIPITNCEFKVDFGFYEDKGVRRTYKIKNAPLTNISNKDVNISTLDALINNDRNYNVGDWEEVLKKARKDFEDHLAFGLEVGTSLEEYFNKIHKEYSKFGSDPNNISSQQEKMDKWMEEGPDTLYEYLKTLNNFIAKADLNPVQENGNRCYSCIGNCEFLDECGSNIKFFGVDCADEKLEHKYYSYIEEDRKKLNSKGSKEIYWMHLRPQTKECDDDLWSLTLRIHFKYLGNRKIEIGWIGRHLYLPCPKRNNITKCIRTECPLHDPKNDNLENYKKQWQ